MYVAIDRQNKTFAIDWQPLQGCVRPVGVGVGGDVCVWREGLDVDVE